MIHVSISGVGSQMMVVAALSLALAYTALGQQSTNISKADVKATLDFIDKALVKKDAKEVVANYASNAVITATTFENGRKDVSTRNRNDYEQALEECFNSYDHYTLHRKDLLIEIAADGKTARSVSVVVENFRFEGEMEQAISTDWVSFVVLDGKVQVAKDQDKTTVQ